jgi:hypothetical protein
MEQEEDDLPVFGDNLMELMNTNGKYPMTIEDLSDDEKEDYYIKDTDAIIVAGKIVIFLPLRKSNTQALKSMSMNKRETIFMCITKLCFQHSLWTSNGSRLALDPSIADLPPKEIMLLLLVSSLKSRFGT